MKDLEEKKKLKSKAAQEGASALDVPYPQGIKRSKINTYQIKQDELDEDRNLLQTGKFPLKN